MVERRDGTSLARLGLTEAWAAPTLAALGWWDGDRPARQAERVMWALARSPDPVLALRAVERLAESAGSGWAALDAALRVDEGLRGRLLSLLGSSTALGDHLVANPDRWQRLSSGRALDPEHPPDVTERTADLLVAVGADPAAPPPGSPGGARAGVTGAEAVTALRLAYRDGLLDIAAADLAAVGEPALPVVPLEVVTSQLADLACAALRAALAVAVAEVLPDDQPDTEPARLAIIGMGKCGGNELNYVSDVDVIFVAEPADNLTTRVASTLMQVAGEACFPVDANLRPEGRQGALVRTLEGHLSYYRRWAKTWEFQALLKARPVAGDVTLAEEYVSAVSPMVWAAAERGDFVAEVRAMRRRVEEHVRPDQADRELKLGRGGLRDVEFAVQLLQLVHGRTDPDIRSGSTLEALAALGDGGYVGRDDAANLAASYRFLRLLEHRLQLERLRRTHLLPAENDVAALRWLARSAKIRPDGRRDAVGVLLAEWRANARRVRRLHEKLFYRPLLETVSKIPGERLRMTDKSATRRL
ncbi:MAG TPA: bifunctional [glutamine synthetase] adenylyltransferase/[glutamine synthetase]-adenylyl-L-tyrosine phosphorylase, partial [Pseudonocardia sp.]